MKKMKLKKLIIAICFTAVSSASFIHYKNTSQILLSDNIEAMTSTENNGIELNFCFKPSNRFTTTNFRCDNRTTYGSDIPMGTIYECPKYKSKVNLFYSKGYCYKSVK